MSNIIYEDKMYNEEVKKEFIEQYGSGTQKTLSRIFKVSYLTEKELGKDLYEFNREQIRRLLFLYMPTTEYSAKQNISWVSKYIDWSIEEGYFSDINPLEGITNEWVNQFVNNKIKKLWTEVEINKIIVAQKNHQDGVIISLLFNGVRGNANSEIVKLKKSDIDSEKNQLHLTDDSGNKRTITVSLQCIAECERALRQEQYDKKGGNASPDIRNQYGELVDNDYVVKSVKTRLEHFEEAEKNVVHRRLTNIAEFIREPYFTPRNIVYSGMLARAKRLYDESGQLGEKEYDDIFAHFGETAEQSKYRLKNEFLNEKNLKTVYELT